MITIEMLRAQYKLAMLQVDEKLHLPIKRYVEALEKRDRNLDKRMSDAEKRISKLSDLLESVYPSVRRDE